ncbi:hypothetical protein ACLTEW_24295 [Gordonia lacunae]|uniref:hypothetical protein n=1 Tax=Gordonia TaxID=2053 RepID=UPI002009E8AD|nr:hypothetical protein [Gordonia terrae]UPW11989.1 hypothetical protein M1C59_25885 [Gordonia terrae]
MEPATDAGPTTADILRRIEFDNLTAATTTGIQKSAEKWSAGIAAVIGAISAMLLFKGTGSLTDVAVGWRIPLFVLSVLALGLAVAALWQLLTVSARRFRIVDRDKVLGEPGALQHNRVQASAADTKRVARAIAFGGLAIALQVVAVACWWIAPAKVPDPPAYLSVKTGGDVVCGKLASADGQVLRLSVPGYDTNRSIPYREVINLTLVAKCP